MNTSKKTSPLASIGHSALDQLDEPLSPIPADDSSHMGNHYDKASVEQAQHEVRDWQSQRLQLGDPLNPYVTEHGRHYDFAWLAELGRNFAEELAGAFARSTASYEASTGRTHYGALKRLLKWVIENKHTHLTLVQHLTTANWRKVPKSLWLNVLYRWHAIIIAAPSPSRLTKGNYIRHVNAAWALLNRRGIVPAAQLNPPTNYRRHGRPKRTLAEVLSMPITPNEDRAVKTLLSQLPAADRKDSRTRDFLSVVISELGSIPDSPQDLANEAHRILIARLNGLRHVFETVLLEDYERFSKSEQLIAGNSHHLKELLAVFSYPEPDSNPRGDPRHKRWVELNKLISEPGSDQGFANWLTYIDGHHGGIPPLRSDPGGSAELTQICKQFGGIRAVHHCLNASNRTLLAAIGLILIDTGFNVSSVVDLEVDCLRPSQRSGHIELYAAKKRARNKDLLAHVPVKTPGQEVSVPLAINIITTMTRRVRRRAPLGCADRLFIYKRVAGQRSGHIGPIDPLSMMPVLRKLLADHAKSFPRYTLDMIRPTLLLIDSFEAHGNLAGAQALGNHSSLDTTKSYSNRWMVRVLWQATMRKFQDLFQTVAIYRIDDAVEKLGLTRSQADVLFFEAQHAGLGQLPLLAKKGRTGRGVVCVDPLAGVQPGTKKGEPCTKQEHCVLPDPTRGTPTCCNMIVVASLENITDMILHLEYLKENQEWMEANRPDRWEAIWIPWYAIAEVVLSQVQRGALAVIHRQAMELAEKRRADGVAFPPL